VLCGCHVYDESLLDDYPAMAGAAAKSGNTGSGGMGGRSGAGGAGSPAAGKGGSGAAGSSGHGGAGAGGAAGSNTSGTGGASGSDSGSGGTGAAGGGGAGTAGASGMGGAGMAGGSAGSSPCVPSASMDCCPDDPSKQDPGSCGCGVPDLDADLDTIADCIDDAPYGWLRQLTLDGAQITAALTNFPVLVRLTDSQLKSTASADGSDIYFTAADKTTLLDFELEEYVASSGALVAWVRIPSLSASTDAVLYLGYDDGKSNRSNATGVWSSYRHVWHLSQDPSLGNAAIKDATQRSDGTARGAMTASALTAAVAGKGLLFDGTDDEITFTNDLTGSGPSTLSGWVMQAADSGDNGSSIISFGNGSLNQSRFLLSLADQQKIKCGFYGNDKLSNTILPLTTWKHVVWVWTGSQSTIYVDGAAILGSTSHTSASTSGATGSIGGTTFGYDFFMTGQLDEVRVATDAKPTGWIATEYNNQRPSSTFIKAVGAAQAAPTH
jgi:hypothetical protein